MVGFQRTVQVDVSRWSKGGIFRTADRSGDAAGGEGGGGEVVVGARGCGKGSTQKRNDSRRR